MRIGDQPNLPQPKPVAKAAPAQAAAGPAMAADSFKASADAVNVVSFNVAGGNSKFKLEGKLIDSPVFQKLIKGDADAPIVACQEMTPALAKKLVEASKNGNFEVIYPGVTWLPAKFPISPFMQGNLLLVPKRYKVEQSEAHTFTGRAKQFFKSLKNWVFGDGKANDLVLAMQNRGYVSAQLKDTKTGKAFSVLGTHIAYKEEERRRSTPELVDAIKKLEAKGPVVVMGDFNVETMETNPNPNQGVKDFWKALDPLELKDMGPTGKDRGTYWGNDKDIDVVLAKGFHSVASDVLTGDENTIPGYDDAKKVSDHYAEADTLQFDQ